MLAAQLTTTDLEDEGGLADESVRERVTSDLLDVSYGGFAPSFNEVNDQTREDLTNAELIAFPILAVLLLIVFRSVVAAADTAGDRGAVDRRHPARAAGDGRRRRHLAVRPQHRDRA